MSDVSIAWAVAALLGLASLVLLVRAAGEGGRTQEKNEELEELRKETKSLRKQVDQRTKAARKSESELERLSRQSERAQRDAASAKGAARGERSKVRERNRDLEEAADRKDEELLAARRELDELAKELARTVQRLETAEQRKAPPPAPAAPDDAVVAELTRRAEQSESSLRERDQDLGTLRAEIERLKKKFETQDLLYVSIRSELAIKKDRLRQQREDIERLRAFKVAVVDEPTPDLERSLEAGVEVPEAESEVPEAESGVPEAESGVPEAGSDVPEAGMESLETPGSSS